MAFSVLLWTTFTVHAAVVTEIGDAGDLPAGAQNLIDGTTQVEGLAGNDDIDTFAFSWGGGALSIDTFGSPFDTILYLFDDAGLGIAANDDSGGLLQSALSFAVLAGGDYFLALGNYSQQPESAGGAIFPSVCCGGQELPTGPGGSQPVIAWDISGAPGTQPYDINFSSPVGASFGQVAAVPVLSDMALLLVALILGLIGFRELRSSGNLLD